MNAQKELSVLLVAFVLLILGIVFVGVLADNLYENTNTYQVVDENFTWTHPTATAATHDDWVRVINVSNSTNQLLTETTDYVIDLTGGTINITIAGNNTDGMSYYYASYEYYPLTYVKNATSRTLLNLIVIFFVIGLIGIVIAMAMKNSDWFGDMKGRL